MKAKHSIKFLNKKQRLVELKIIFMAGYMAGKLGDDSDKSLKLTLSRIGAV